MELYHTPKVIIEDFYLDQGLFSKFYFKVERNDKAAGRAGDYRCTLTCPPVTAQGHSFQGGIFIADAAGKKGAKQAASERALVALHSAGVLPPSTLPRPSARPRAMAMSERAMLALQYAGVLPPSPQPRPEDMQEALALLKTDAIPHSRPGEQSQGSPGVGRRMAPAQDTPQSIIQGFYLDQASNSAPKLEFEVELDLEASATFGFDLHRCRLTCPLVTGNGHTFHGDTIIGRGRTRLGATTAASQRAWMALHLAGVLSAPLFPRPETLPTAMALADRALVSLQYAGVLPLAPNPRPEPVPGAIAARIAGDIPHSGLSGLKGPPGDMCGMQNPPTNVVPKSPEASREGESPFGSTHAGGIVVRSGIVRCIG
jgi:hypothetical protein